MARKFPTTKQMQRVTQLMQDLEPRLLKAFLAAMQSAAGKISINDLAAALEARDLDRALAMFKVDASVWFPLREAMRSAYIAAGTSITTSLPVGIAGTFGFDGEHPVAKAWIEANGADRITGLSDEMVATARSVILEGMKANVGTREIARSLVGRVVSGKRIGGFIGLTEGISRSIMMGRAKLMSGDPKLMAEYLKLELRDKRYDKLIRKAMAAQRPVSASNLNTIMEAHRSKALGYRGKLIAKDQVFTAQANGRREAYRQVMEKGGVESITKTWRHGLSTNPRHAHQDLDGTQVMFDQKFDVEGVLMDNPHDPVGGAAQNAHCRCTVFYRVNPVKD